MAKKELTMGLKFCQLGVFALLFLCLTGCEGEKKESRLEELDRMAKERVQPAQHHNIAEGLEPESEADQVR